MPINQLLSIIYDQLTAAGTLLYYIPTVKFEVSINFTFSRHALEATNKLFSVTSLQTLTMSALTYKSCKMPKECYGT